MPQNTLPIITPVIAASWLERSALQVAPDLLGCTMVRKLPNGQQLRGTIIETEAYEEGDPACHAYRKKTDRNWIMFGPPGYTYVYLIYGMYHCVNIVTDRDEFASAVLIRALDMETIPKDYELGKPKPKEKLHRIAAGPGKLCRVMQIDQTLYGTKLDGTQPLWLEHRTPEWQQSLDLESRALVQTTRIGLTQGVELPWRWYVKDNPAVSKLIVKVVSKVSSKLGAKI